MSSVSQMERDDMAKMDSFNQASKNQYENAYTTEKFKKLPAELMLEENDSKYRNLVLSTAYSDQRPPIDPIDDAEYRLEQLQDQPRYDPDKAMMSI